MDWSVHLSGWKDSGLSRKAYCAQQDISYQTFLYHQKRIHSSAPVFDQVRISSAVQDEKIEYHFPDGGYLSFSSRSMRDVLITVGVL
jgi:hypothetical protein